MTSNVTLFGELVAPTPIDPGQMLRHLQVLHGGGLGTGDVVLSFLSPHEKTRQYGVDSDFGDMVGAVETVQPMVDAGFGVYVSVNRFVADRSAGQSSRHKRDVSVVTGVVADLDVKPHALADGAEVDRLLGAVPTPTMVVGSGSGGAHAYWLFEQPTSELERAQRLGKAWVRCLEGTAAGLLGRGVRLDYFAGLNRVLRVAGTWRHPKAGETFGPQPVVLRWSEGPRYSLEALESVVPEAELSGAGAPISSPSAASGTGEADAGWIANMVNKAVEDLAAVPSGYRNEALNRAAYTLGGLGAHGFITMEDALARVLDACGRNGLLGDDGEEQCRASFLSGWESGLLEPLSLPKAGSGGSGGSEPWPNPGASLRVARKIEGLWSPHIKHWRGEWHRHIPDRNRWEPAEEAAVKKALYQVLEDVCYVNEKKEVVRWDPNAAKVSSVMDAYRSIRYLDKDIDQPDWLQEAGAGKPPSNELMVCTNGILHFPSRTVLPHDPWLFNRVVIDAAYDGAARCPRWVKFLEQLWPDDPDQALLLGEWFGYVLSGETKAQKMALLVGPKRAGKGTIADVLTALMGGETVARTLRNFTEGFGLQPLLGRPLCIIGDARLSGDTKPIVEQLLTISGGDVVTVERKHLSSVSVRLRTRFMLLSNELPVFNDASGALASRFVLMQLSRSFIGHEDLDLGRKLLGELPGILRWSLDGLDRLRSQGWRFTQPQSSAQAIQDLADASSPVSVFVRECCVVGTGCGVDRDQLYAAWAVWAVSNGHSPLSKIVFGRNLTAAVDGLRRTQPKLLDGSRGNFYGGISLKPPSNLPVSV